MGDTFPILSRELGGKICVIPTLDAFLFESECNTDSIHSLRRCEVCAAHAGRVRAISVRGACRISGNFANFSRDFCARFASSRRWTRGLSCITTHTDSDKSCNEVLRFAQPRWPSSRNLKFARASRRKISGTLQWERVTHWKSYSEIFSRDPLPPLRSYMEKLHRRRFYHDGTPPPP